MRYSGKETTPKEAVGVYWFVNTDVARNLDEARLRMREFKSLGFTEVWIAERGITEIGAAKTALLCEDYGRFLEQVADEADHLGLGVIPFVMPCCLHGLGTTAFGTLLSAVATSDGATSLTLNFGNAPAVLLDVLKLHRAFAYRTEWTSLGETIIAGSVRPLSIGAQDLKLIHENGKLVTTLPAELAEEGEEVFVALATPAQVSEQSLPSFRVAPDVTSPQFKGLLGDIVTFHESILRDRPCHRGLAFDEPNVHDLSIDEYNKHDRLLRCYWSDSLATRLKEKRGIDFHETLYGFHRPLSDIGYEVRFAYFEEIQNALMEAIEESMGKASVPMLGTHDWSGDRDRALYNTFDQLQFSRVRSYGASDISGFQGHGDYATQEPLLAYAQKETYGKERAMMMTDHFAEPVDLNWLLNTCERHAALGIDYMLLHAFGSITPDPPLWTRTESWIAYREAHALEYYTTRMKQLAGLRDYEGKPNILVVFPRYSRLMAAGDRYATREWVKMYYLLHRAHFSPMTLSQIDLCDVVFEGKRAKYQGHEFEVIALPYFTAIRESEMRALVDFYKAGGKIVVTKPNYLFADEDGKPSQAVQDLFEELFDIQSSPAVRRITKSQTFEYAGATYRAQGLPSGVSEYDDCYLDFGSNSILKVENEQGGQAILIGFEMTALSFAEELHDLKNQDSIRLLDTVFTRLAPKSMNCTTSTGEKDYGTFGLLRHRDGESLLTVHRMHDELSMVSAQQATLYLPAKTTQQWPTGASAFIHHVEETCHVIYNPFAEILREVDLEREIESILTYDEKAFYSFTEGSTVRMALPPRRELRFRNIRFGRRDPRLPSGFRSEDGEIIQALTDAEDCRRTTVRVKGGDSISLSLTLDTSLGEKVDVMCKTMQQPCEFKLEFHEDRLSLTIVAPLKQNIENEIIVTQVP